MLLTSHFQSEMPVLDATVGEKSEVVRGTYRHLRLL